MEDILDVPLKLLNNNYIQQHFEFPSFPFITN